MKTLFAIAALLCLPAMLWAAPYSGQVLDELTGEPIANADLVDRQGRHVNTAADGTFTLDVANPSVMVVKPGFQESSVVLKANVVNKIKLSLKGSYQLPEVDVKAKPDTKKVIVSKQHMDKEQIKEVTTTIFPDVLKTVQLLPGVTASNDFSSLLYVRGGDPDEVISVLDGMIIPNPYMWGGLVSIFDPAMVEEVDFSTGGFPAEWPQAMSAILNVKNKVSSPERFQGFVDVSAASLDVYLQGPLAGNLGGDQNSSFLFGVRRTYYDLQQKLYNHDNMVYPYFYSGQAKATLPLKNGTITVNSLFSVEGMNMVSKSDQDYDAAHTGDSTFKYMLSQMLLGVSYDLKLSDTVSVMTLAGGDFGDGTFEVMANPPSEDSQTSTFWQVRNIWQWLPNDHHIVKAGINLFPGDAQVEYKITYKIPTLNSSTGYYEDILEEKTKINYFYSSVFVQDDIELVDDLLYINPGINGQYFENNHQWIGNPRLALKLKLTPDWETYVATGLYSQFSVDASIDGKLGNPNLQARQSMHYVWGSKMDIGRDIFVQVETYYKDYHDLVTADPDPNLNYTNNAIGRAYGADLIIQKKISGNLDGWLTYSYVKSERKITARNDPRLYGKPDYTTPIDQWYVSDSDRPNTLNLIANYIIVPRWKISLTQKYCTGKPYTPVAGADPLGGDQWVPRYGAYNSARMPDFWSTDIKLSMPVGKLKGWTAYCQISNLFNVENVDSYQYKTDYSDKRPVYQYPFTIIGGIHYDY
jgi:hypothetical protein